MNAMKLAKLALAMTAITLLSSPAFAGGVEDSVLASFERDLNYEAAHQVARPSAQVEIDPLVEALRAALARPAKPDAHAAAAIGGNGG